MVLKLLPALLFVLHAWAADPQVAYTRANELAQKNHKEPALRLLEANYNLRSHELPVKVAALATSLLLNSKRWHKAEQVADGALNNNWPGWLTKRPVKPQPEFWDLVKMSARAKIEILEAGEEGRDRNRLKTEIQNYGEVLSANSATSEEAKALIGRVQTRVDDKADPYHFAWSLLLSYWTWEDRPTFDYHIAGKSKVFSPCFGLGLDYTDEFLHWSVGACGGGGAASLQFDNGTYDNRANVTLLAGYGSVLKRLSSLGSAFGLEADVMNITTKGRLADGSTPSAANQEFAITAVGRYRVGKFDFKFKGGPVISTPSALWSFELAYLF